MDPKLKSALAVIAATAVAVLVGFRLAEGELGVPLLLAGLTVLLALQRFTGVSPEALALIGAVFGYLVGNRGFAQISLIPGLPALAAECALALALPIIVVRCAFARELPLRRDALNFALAGWLIVCGARLVPDLPRWGFLAIRDFASVYYVLFFFIAQYCARRASDRGVINGAILAGMLVLVPMFVLSELFPDLFFSLRVGGIPPILYKPDLVSTMLAAGVVLFYAQERVTGNRLWVLASLAALGVMAYIITRSVMVGLATATMIFLFARDRRFLLHLSALVVLALTGLAVEAAFSPRDITQSKLYSIYEHAVSIADFGGSRSYRNAEAASSGDNNRFRLTWWRTVAQQALAENPLLGLGFGADLSNEFVRDYYGPDHVDFAARSPHNFLITLFGRTGTVGALAFGAVLLAMARGLFDTIALVRRSRGDEANDAIGLLGAHAAIWVILVASFFGVVLEGPMGAVPFWILLGITHGRRVDA